MARVILIALAALLGTAPAAVAADRITARYAPADGAAPAAAVSDGAGGGIVSVTAGRRGSRRLRVLRLAADGRVAGDVAVPLGGDPVAGMLAADGRALFVAATATVEGGRRPILIRLLETGATDPRFGVGGLVVMDVPTAALLPVGGGGVLVLRADGRVTRLGADGRPVSAYGDGGTTRLPATDEQDGGLYGERGLGLAPRADGGVLLITTFTRVDGVSGLSTSGTVWRRVTPGGAVDPGRRAAFVALGGAASGGTTFLAGRDDCFAAGRCFAAAGAITPSLGFAGPGGDRSRVSVLRGITGLVAGAATEEGLVATDGRRAVVRFDARLRLDPSFGGCGVRRLEPGLRPVAVLALGGGTAIVARSGRSVVALRLDPARVGRFAGVDLLRRPVPSILRGGQVVRVRLSERTRVDVRLVLRRRGRTVATLARATTRTLRACDLATVRLRPRGAAAAILRRARRPPGRLRCTPRSAAATARSSGGCR